MIYVKVYNNNVEKAISTLKKQVKETKLMLELREREFYKKKSTKRKERKAKARLRAKNNSNNGQQSYPNCTSNMCCFCESATKISKKLRRGTRHKKHSKIKDKTQTHRASKATGGTNRTRNQLVD